MAVIAIIGRSCHLVEVRRSFRLQAMMFLWLFCAVIYMVKYWNTVLIELHNNDNSNQLMMMMTTESTNQHHHHDAPPPRPARPLVDTSLIGFEHQNNIKNKNNHYSHDIHDASILSSVDFVAQFGTSESLVGRQLCGGTFRIWFANVLGILSCSQ